MANSNVCEMQGWLEMEHVRGDVEATRMLDMRVSIESLSICLRSVN